MHHALALGLPCGIAHADLSNRPPYTLAGFQQNDPARSVLNPASAPTTVLRGFQRGAFSGEAFTLGTAEDRFPLWNVETGVWTLPFYLRRLHAAIFTDLVEAFTPPKPDFQ